MAVGRNVKSLLIKYKIPQEYLRKNWHKKISVSSISNKLNETTSITTDELSRIILIINNKVFEITKEKNVYDANYFYDIKKELTTPHSEN